MVPLDLFLEKTDELNSQLSLAQEHNEQLLKQIEEQRNFAKTLAWPSPEELKATRALPAEDDAFITLDEYGRVLAKEKYDPSAGRKVYESS